MKQINRLFHLLFLLMAICVGLDSFSQINDAVAPRHKVTLPQAHVGDLDIDIKLLDSYELLPDNIRQFYLDARTIFYENADAGFTHPAILKSARKNGLALMSGPLAGNLKEDGVTLWLRPAMKTPVVVNVTNADGSNEKLFVNKQIVPGKEQRIKLSGLDSNTAYNYAVSINDSTVAEGKFKTAPTADEKSTVRLAFGSCFHKIGLHNPNLINQILKREPHAMMLLGDIAVDDRENNVNMHRSDYLLRDVSKAWSLLAANVPLYTSWDDHDYLNNDLSGIPDGFTSEDREALRAVWKENWNNPKHETEGIYFSTRIGAVELIMLDTRSCRNNEERGKYGSYLGIKQQTWLKETLKNSSAKVKIISSGTMWSDYITNGKDSWGTWDTLAREEIFSFIETENISGVLLISGDRHGARGFRIPRPSGFYLYEFEPASLGGVPGPVAMAADSANQLFGYLGTDIIAFGEFTIDAMGKEPLVTFRLIDESGTIREEYILKYSQLTP
jgi:alkaline phosphatase D